ncbi:hypothetical protein [Amphiplicatus metriothermophilus]|nr:hypothetical protein [Amphiplicatus metriothermophilus]MBB5518681.1 hypothetical protein [Amphiplicatus metriothermophilus]
MKTRIILAGIGALALGLAACGERAPEETVPAEEETAPPEDDGTAGADAMRAMGEASPAALACVKDPSPESICTMDINACGFSSVCQCGEGYVYDAALGKCLLDLEGFQGEAVRVAVDETDCAQAAAGACTRDINACGHPSRCDCPDGFVWNAVAGLCLRDMSRPAEQ